MDLVEKITFLIDGYRPMKPYIGYHPSPNKRTVSSPNPISSDFSDDPPPPTKKDGLRYEIYTLSQEIIKKKEEEAKKKEKK
jgi:hypothetical protein